MSDTLNKEAKLMIRLLEFVSNQDPMITMIDNNIISELINYGYITIISDIDETTTYLTEHGKNHLQELKRKL